MANGPRTIVWLEPTQWPMLRALADRLDLDLVGAGSPEPTHAAAVANRFGVPSHDDLRATLTTADCELLLIASPGGDGDDAALRDQAVLDAANARGMRVATLEPIPASTMDTIARKPGRSAAGPSDTLAFLPLVRRSRVLRELADPIRSLGPVRTAWIESIGRPEHGSLGARLFSACDLVVSLLGVPELVDAAYARPVPGRPLHALPGDSLRGLTGDMTLNLRFPDGRACGILASDHAASWSRSLRLLGDAGEIRADDAGFTWLDAEGTTIETWRHPERNAEHTQCDGLDEIAAAITAMLAPVSPDEQRIEPASVLNVTQAALLSARTGQAESPETMRKIGVVG